MSSSPQLHAADVLEVHSPYDGELLGTLPRAHAADVDAALDRAERAHQALGAIPLHGRAEILERAARAIDDDQSSLADLITREQGKHRHDAAAEASRIGGILHLCAEEALRLDGEVLPMDAAPQSVGRHGYTTPEPAGIVAAISPFNYPAILVAHKIGPALAAGNATILKPASVTPLTAHYLVDKLNHAGLPNGSLQCLVGSGSELGRPLVSDPRVRRITFTGSYDVGAQIAADAGPKRITAAELGSNAAMVVLDDADLDRAALSAVRSGFTNAGQNCVSTQRLIVQSSIFAEFTERLLDQVARLVPGDPSAPATTLAPMTEEREAQRVIDWVREACDGHATLLTGGGRDGNLVEPFVLVDAPASSRIWREELFGPGIVLAHVETEDDALAAACDTRFGLACSVLTQNIDRGLRFARRVRAGIVNVNPPTGNTWRSDFMPWGGVGASGFGREGVKYALREFSEYKLVVIHPGDAR